MLIKTTLKKLLKVKKKLVLKRNFYFYFSISQKLLNSDEKMTISEERKG